MGLATSAFQNVVDNNNGMQWILVTILTCLLWKPIRTLINQWRLHRRQKKYPQLVVCRVEKAKSNNGKLKRTSVVESFKTVASLLLSAIPFLLILLLKLLQILRNAILTLLPLPTKQITSKGPAPPSYASPTSVPATKRTSPPPSVLRKAGSSSSVHSRVEFAEHSNGHVRTERRYYLPHAQPNQSIQSPNSPSSPQEPQPQRAETTSTFLTPEWPIYRSVTTKRETVNAPQSHSHIDRPPIQDHQISYPQSMVEYQSSAQIGPISQARLSEQMRKRRLDKENDHLSAKRSSLGGRVGLAATRPRIISTRRTVLNKRQREEREDRILKDLNTKRSKQKEEAKYGVNTSPAASFSSTPAPSQTPAVSTSFQLSSAPTPSSSKEPSKTTTIAFGTPSTATETEITNTTASNGSKPPSFSFASETADSTQLAAGNSTKGLPPAFSLDGTPAPAPTVATTNSTGFSLGENSSATSLPGTGFSFGNARASSSDAPLPSFAFGAPAPAPSAPASSTTTATATSSSFGSADGAAPSFQFSAPAPAPPTDKSPGPNPGFSFGNASAPSLVASIPAATVQSVGAPPTSTPATGFSFGSASRPSSEAPALEFGRPEAPTPTPSLGFSFGNASAPHPEATTPAPAFQFGGPTPTPATGFSFSSASAPSSEAPAPTLKFGGQAAAPTPSAGFSFGTASAPHSEAPTSAPAFQFGGPPPTLTPTTGFSFGSASGSSSAAPLSSLQFGASNPSPATGFTMSTHTNKEQPAIPQFGFPATDSFAVSATGGGASARRRAKVKTGSRR